MFDIVEARFLAPEVKLFRIKAPEIARKQKAGQFIILRIHERGERVPLTIADSNPEDGSVTIIVQGVGKTTKLLNQLKEGDQICDVVGPLGRPSEIAEYGTAVVIGGGLGTAIAYPTARALRKAGNHVITIIGARSKNLVLLENEMRAISNETYVTTDDGSYAEKGFVTDKLRSLIEQGHKIGLVLAIGPIPMMRAIAETTRPHAIKTLVSLNPIMVDGTGMCGGCRVIVDHEAKFACVDGPEFDAHKVDFKVLTSRNNMYREMELISLQMLQNQAVDQPGHPAEECKLLALQPENAAVKKA